MPEDDYHLVDLYDSCEDPEFRSEFLDSFGITRPDIDGLRRRRDAERKIARSAGDAASAPDGVTTTPRHGHSPRRSARPPRARRRRRVVVTHPRTRGLRRRRPARNRSEVVLVLVLKFGG
ncbi:hypothetical protein ACQSMD_19595 [Streptomyces flavovirens]|uniref:hypothetical protein n=1 Tax=Streptomyces flavovirens TaxID=52258 RepID=UPI003D13C83D